MRVTVWHNHLVVKHCSLTADPAGPTVCDVSGSQALDTAALVGAGLADEAAHTFAAELDDAIATSPEASAVELWSDISRRLLTPAIPFSVHQLVYQWVYRDWDPGDGPPPAWIPDADRIADANVSRLAGENGAGSLEQLHAWSAADPSRYWGTMVDALGIIFHRPAERVVDLRRREAPLWLPGAALNISESCFGGSPEAVAIEEHAEGRATPRSLTFDALDRLSNRVANGIVAAGHRPGERLAILMPMTIEAVAIYLGIIKAGCTAVGIADSFAADEIRVRLEITGCTRLFAQDHMRRGGRTLPLLAKAIDAAAPPAVVIGREGRTDGLRGRDSEWQTFLPADEAFQAVSRDPGDHTNILFSSGTTGKPKAIPWTHTTPIKCAADAWAHQDIHPGDVLAWPTSLGWMMGPWLIYASLINRASMALFDGAPTGREFGMFVEAAGVTMLGVVPSLVHAWRSSDCMAGLDWTHIRTFSSTGESSNADDMLFLMALADYRPMVEYCGGTEIGGGYVTGTVVQPAAPTVFTTAALGLDLTLVDDAGEAAEVGEVMLNTPSIGLSTELLNADHHSVYFAGTPAGESGAPLRRHGDQLERLPGGGFRVHGRVDDTMNLGGIKVSSVEIERVLNAVDGVAETAAIAVPPAQGGPSELVVYAVLDGSPSPEPGALATTLQQAIRSHLNPLFRIADVVVRPSLPRTASNKTMRRVLRADYVADRA